MAYDLTDDPIMSLQDAKEMGNVNDEQTAIKLINIVSSKFLVHTNRVHINQAAIQEQVSPYDGNAAFAHATPIDSANPVSVVEAFRDGRESVTYLSSNVGELIVDYTAGRILKVGGCWTRWQGFRNLTLLYTGGWAVVPVGIVAGALAQMKVEQDRLKGLVGIDSTSGAGQTISPDRSGVIEEAADAWETYKIWA